MAAIVFAMAAVLPDHPGLHEAAIDFTPRPPAGAGGSATRARSEIVGGHADAERAQVSRAGAELVDCIAVPR